MSGSPDARAMRPPPTSHRRPVFFWIVVATGVVMLALHAFAWASALRRKDQVISLGWHKRTEGSADIVSAVDVGSPAAGRLEVGDRVLAIDGTPAPEGYMQIFVRRLEDPYSVLVRRGDDVRQVRLWLAITSEPGHFRRQVLPYLVASMAFGLVGIVVGLLRPDSRIAHLLFAAFLAASVEELQRGFVGSVLDFASLVGGERVFAVLLAMVWPFSLVVIYHFFSEVPTGQVPGPGWTRLRAILYGGAVLLWGPNLFVALFFADRLRWMVGRAGQFRMVAARMGLYIVASSVFEAAVLVATAAVLVANYRRVRDPDQARRLRWVVFGCVLALTPAVPAILFHASSQTIGLPGLGLRRVVNTFAVWSPILIPLTFAHAVLRHQLLDVHVVIRRGVQ